MLPPIEELNALDEAGFARALEPLFEGAPAFLARLAAARRFSSYQEMLDRALVLAFQLPEPDRLELINSHPRIGAAPASVSELSYREQGYDRDAGTDELQARLDELNEAYERRFGFRFVTFVAGRPRSEIAWMMERQLAAERAEELERAVRDVIAIARDRLVRLDPWEGRA
jgi:2-oxo-4-hydroxy-4-carboxy--5-ureidoimidazoline (OHCU) decarboxylase